MNKPLTAGERLAPDPRIGERRRAGPLAPPLRGRDPRRRKAKPRRFRWLGRIFGALLGIVALAAGVGAVAGYTAYRHFNAGLPDVEGLRNYQPRVMSRIYASDSRLLAEMATERRIFVPYVAIPDMVKRAFIAAEDQNFWTHPGVDPLAMARAAVTDLEQYGEGRRPIGASTITQQVAKNMLLGNEVSLNRKAKEVLLAYLQQLRTNPSPGPLGPRLASIYPSLNDALARHLADLDQVRAASQQVTHVGEMH